MGSDVAEAQIDELSDAEIDVLLEIYEVRPDSTLEDLVEVPVQELPLGSVGPPFG
jgi:hypothetical protein